MSSKVVAASKIDLSWAGPDVKIWIELPEGDPSGEAYKRGVIVNVIDDETANVKFEGSTAVQTMKGDKIFPLNNYNDHPEGYDDMVEIENLSEAELLYNVQMRFSLKQIYTYVGPTLIVINPFMRIEKLLSNEMLERFQSAVMENRFEFKDHIPHVYAIAAATMTRMFEEKKNQAVVISGESGAGKTENTKHAMKFLTSLGSKATGNSQAQGGGVEDRILACNPILEAFGNAKTMRNDNSSRFGKYVSLLVEKSSRKIIGATITNYLLEKSRVCGQTSEERNYHIFYALLRGAKEEQLKELCLVNDLNEYNYLKNGYKGDVKTVPDPPLYEEVSDSFRTMSFSDIEQKTIWSLTACSLLLGNVNFDDSTLNDTSPCNIKNDDILKNVAKLLGLEYPNFSKSLTFKLRTIGGNTIESTINKEECLIYRDGLAKEIFNRLFNWLVKRLNFNVMPENFSKPGANIQDLMKTYYHIGLLDIFGFEIFKVNSLEQFCINFANERLQQLYIAYVFKAEEKEFINEGLKDFLSELNFKDNQGLLDMLDGNKPPGIFQLIDESCSVTATDSALGTKIIGQFKKPEFPLTTAKMAKDTFIVKHSAKDVEYDVNGFRAKNKDELSKFIEDNLTNSSIKAVSRIWRNLTLDEPEPLDSKKAINPKDKFLGYKFRVQMKDLIDELNSCECHFIRCIKPNEKKEAALFEPAMVLQQIQYMGVLDTIKVRKQSFPVRRLYKSYYERYQELDPVYSKITYEEHIAKGSDFKEMTKNICERRVPHLGSNMILFGNTRVFLRIEAVKELEKLRSDHIKKKNLTASKFQAAWKGFKQRRKYRALLKGTKEVQKLFRVGKEFQKYQYLKRIVKRIQRKLRYVLWRQYIQKLRKANLKIQTWWRSKYYRKKYLKQRQLISTINKVWRGAIARRQVARLRHVKEIIEEILHKGAEVILKHVHERTVKKLQPSIRGFLIRRKYHKQVAQIKKTKAEYIYNKNIRVIQRNIRRFIVRRTMKRMRIAASFIQGHFRMIWLSTLFQALRVGTRRIQKTVRSWLLRRNIIRERIREFNTNELSKFEGAKKHEQNNFFGSIAAPKNSLTGTAEDKKNKTLKNNSKEDEQYDELNSKEANGAPGVYEDELSRAELNLNIDRGVDAYAAKKIILFSRVIDLESLSDLTEIYGASWSLHALQLQNECMRADAELQLMEVGQAHTILVSDAQKVYSYGWNDYHQLGRYNTQELRSSYGQIPTPHDQFKPKSIAAGDDHTIMTDYDGNLYIWGDNSQGQLGIGSCGEMSGIKVLSFTKNDEIKEIKAKGNNSLVVTEKGKALYWPTLDEIGDITVIPTELPLPPKIEIATASCGYNFAALVSKNGLVFTFGQSCEAGQLGHGDTILRNTPTIIEALKKEGEKISVIACGFRHVICKTSLGKIYTWGWGAKGQLGHGSFENELSPRLLPLGPQNTGPKAVQVQAGFKHSVVFLDNKKIIWWGSNGTIENQSTPVELNLYQKIPNMNNDLIPVRVLCSWSKTTNLTYVTLADTRSLDINSGMKHKVISMLTSKFEENQAFNDVNPPDIPTISRYFPLKTMSGITKKNLKTSPKIKSPVTSTTDSANKIPTSTSKFDFKDVSSSPQSSARQTSPQRFTLQIPQKTDRTDRKDTQADTKPSPNNILLTSFLKDELHAIITTRRETTEESSPLAKSQRLSPTRDLSSRKDLTKTSPLTSKRGGQSPIVKASPNEKSEKKKIQSFTNKVKDELAYGKLVEIKKKMKTILKTPQNEWTSADKAFWKYITKPEMYALLQDVKIKN